MNCYFKIIFPLNIEDGFVYEYDSEIKKGVRVEVDLCGERKIGIVWKKTEKPFFKTKRIKKIIDEKPLLDESLIKTIQFTSIYYNAPLGMVIRSAFPKKLFQQKNLDIELDTEINWGKKPTFSEEQEKAYHEIVPYIEDNTFQTFLLFGVPGSGKTELCLRLIEYVLKNEGSVLVLVPEILITSQLIKIFSERFGEKAVDVNHSRLTPKQRFNVWCKAKIGTIKVLIGTRSSIFVPLKNIKLIIVDNEQDESYKQENIPLYNAKDVAIMRAKYSHISIVLVSATPSLESLWKAKNGEYKLIELKKRIQDRRQSRLLANTEGVCQNVPLPQIKVVSLGKNLITPIAKREMRNTLRNQKSTVVLINRRGFSSFIICRECGYIFKCSKCSVSLAYYKDKGFLKCHFCGTTYPLPNMCPRCGGFQLIPWGTGTEKMEKSIKAIFPQSYIIRVDRNTMSKKKGFQKILKEIKEEKADIIVGTQMLSKGHSWPHIGLVVVASFEALLSSPDVRAMEKAVSLVIQTSGIVGTGKVIVQSLNPDNPLFEYIEKNDWKSFAEKELKDRQTLLYPPFVHLIKFIFQGRGEKKVERQVQKFTSLLRTKEDLVYGPIKAPIGMIKNKFRYQVLIKTNDVENTLKKINEIKTKGIKTMCDVDPMSFF